MTKNKHDYGIFVKELLMFYPTSRNNAKSSVFVRRSYDILKPTVENFQESDFVELGNKILNNKTFFPSVKEINEFARPIRNKINYNIGYGQSERVDGGRFNVPELPVVEEESAICMMESILSRHFVVESVKSFLREFGILFSGLFDDDFHLFAKKLRKSGGEITAKRILDYFVKLKSKRSVISGKGKEFSQKYSCLCRKMLVGDICTLVSL